MTMDITQKSTQTKEGPAYRSVIRSLDTVRTNIHRMPVGGWLREITTPENWRTTTIVQRHRDSTTSVPSR